MGDAKRRREQFRNQVNDLLSNKKLKAVEAARTLIAMAMDVMLEECEGTEFTDPRYAAGGLLMELYELMTAKKCTPDEIHELVLMTLNVLKEATAAETPTHWNGLKIAETGTTPEQTAEMLAQATGLPITVADLEQYLVEEMGVKFEEKLDPATGEVVRVPVPPPGLEDWFCAVPVGEAPQKT
jgi:hypothetical protein